MKLNLKHTLFILLAGWSFSFSNAQITERQLPDGWENLVKGTRFVDRFMPMKGEKQSVGIWGADGVSKRFVDNGIEDDHWSYWGGNILKDEKDGLYHLFVCGWPEASDKGHMEWPNSYVFHAVSNSLHGPYRTKHLIGKGHNPEVYKTPNGHYILYVIDGYYEANDLNGPWSYKKFEFDPRDRRIIEGLSNLTFAEREDGSRLMICRGGGVWISRDGEAKYEQISDRSSYPPVEGEFEDPVVWRDSVQYNLIVNDWLGRIAYYLRSKDGLHWITEPGEAYVPGIAFHADGTREEWFKYERLKIFQDEFGRAIQANFAVIDTIKWEDKGCDGHGSKNITIPLNPGLRMQILNEKPITGKTKEVSVRILKEEGGNLAEEIDVESLRLGDPMQVNYGKGGLFKRMVKEENGDVILVFDARSIVRTQGEFAMKLTGRYKGGDQLFAYACLPEFDKPTPMLSCRKPHFDWQSDKTTCSVEVSNFGIVASEGSEISIYHLDKEKESCVAHASCEALAPYAKCVVTLSLSDKKISKGDAVKVVVKDRRGYTEEFQTTAD